ncbi:WW domain-containing oxidoreductase [Durusdinium trenchii]|uniref:WW domain-containing oxidoreductase n=1 Tax=Durusdinium trenchii TaxID=1381693 RepID=A0ABP0SP12_9DINO
MSQYLLRISSWHGPAPGLFGPFVVDDEVVWSGDITLNYNAEAVYYNAGAANHLEAFEPYFQAILDFIPAARRMAAELYPNCPDSLAFPAHLLPEGVQVPGVGRGDLGQKQMGLFAAVPFILYWRYTGSLAFAERALPFLNGVARFWECNLVAGEDAYLHDAEDCFSLQLSPDLPQEICLPDGDVQPDPTVVLSLLPGFFQTLAERARHGDAGAPASASALQQLARRVAPYATEEVDGAQVVADFYGGESAHGRELRLHAGGSVAWGGLFAAFPLGTVHRRSRKEEIELVHRSLVRFFKQWPGGKQGNSFPHAFAAAARVGWFDGLLEICQVWESYLTNTSDPKCRLYSNGMVLGCGGTGLENVGGAAFASEMLLSTAGGVLEVFPAPLDTVAAFRLRAPGPLLVTAQMAPGHHVTVRWAAGCAGGTSGGKGKSGKSKKGTAYFVDYDGETWCPEVYVLSLAEDESSDDLATSKAIVDTGGGHLILDLLEPRTPLRFLIQRLNNQLNGPRPPGNDEPDAGDEDGDDGDDDDGHGGRRRKRSRNEAGFEAARDLLRASMWNAHREDAAVGAIRPEDHVDRVLMAAGPSNLTNSAPGSPSVEIEVAPMPEETGRPFSSSRLAGETEEVAAPSVVDHDIMMVPPHASEFALMSEGTRLDEIILGSPEREERDRETAVHGDGHGDSGHGHEHGDSGLEHGLEVSGHVHEPADSGHGSEVEASGGHEVHEHDECQLAVRADEKLGEALMSSTSCGTTRTSEKGYGIPLPKSTSPVKPTSKTEPKKKVDKMTASPSTATPATASSLTPLDIETVSIESGTSIEEVETVLETVAVTKSRKGKKEKESEILKGMKHAWQQQTSSLEKDVEKHIFQVMDDRDQISSASLPHRLPEGQRPGPTMAALLDDVRRSELPGLVEDEPQHLPEHEILALSRKRIDAEEEIELELPTPSEEPSVVRTAPGRQGLVGAITLAGPGRTGQWAGATTGTTGRDGPGGLPPQLSRAPYPQRLRWIGDAGLGMVVESTNSAAFMLLTVPRERSSPQGLGPGPPRLFQELLEECFGPSYLDTAAASRESDITLRKWSVGVGMGELVVAAIPEDRRGRDQLRLEFPYFTKDQP